jgi:hypothetical protein
MSKSEIPDGVCKNWTFSRQIVLFINKIIKSLILVRYT